MSKEVFPRNVHAIGGQAQRCKDAKDMYKLRFYFNTTIFLASTKSPAFNL